MADDMTDDMNKAIELNRRRFSSDRKEIESLQDVLEKLACHHVTQGPLWWQVEARSALAKLSQASADLDIIEEFVRRNVGGQPALDAIRRLRSLSHMDGDGDRSNRGALHAMTEDIRAHAQCVPHHDLLAATVSCKGYDITISCDDYDIRDHLMDWLSGCRTPAEGEDKYSALCELHGNEVKRSIALEMENDRLRAQVEEVDAWLAKAADQLNITPIMQAMDLGNEITQWRLAKQKHTSTECQNDRG